MILTVWEVISPLKMWHSQNLVNLSILEKVIFERKHISLSLDATYIYIRLKSKKSTKFSTNHEAIYFLRVRIVFVCFLNIGCEGETQKSFEEPFFFKFFSSYNINHIFFFWQLINFTLEATNLTWYNMSSRFVLKKNIFWVVLQGSMHFNI